MSFCGSARLAGGKIACMLFLIRDRVSFTFPVKVVFFKWDRGKKLSELTSLCRKTTCLCFYGITIRGVSSVLC